jgi:regulator of replication initiation timing
LESSIEIDFKKVLSDAKDQAKEIDSMRAMADAMVAEEQRRRMEEEARRRRPNRYQLKTIEEEVDDNPSFSSTMRMASPAPADHFLRVFGQPSRDGLGEFRDHSASLRQQLMMLNGKATHEASRVGTLEPLHTLLAGDSPNIDQAIKIAYLEALTREPTAEEIADARAVLTDGVRPIDGMADLRWAIFNSHEFRFLP